MTVFQLLLMTCFILNDHTGAPLQRTCEWTGSSAFHQQDQNSPMTSEVMCKSVGVEKVRREDDVIGFKCRPLEVIEAEPPKGEKVD